MSCNTEQQCCRNYTLADGVQQMRGGWGAQIEEPCEKWAKILTAVNAAFSMLFFAVS